MNLKKIITAVLLIFVAVSIIFLFIKETQKNNEMDLTNESIPDQGQVTENNLDAVAVLPPNADVDIVYYFMTSARCPSCRKIEEYTKEAVQNNFTDEIKKNRMQWRMVQVDKPDNRHFIDEYRLYTKSVVLVKIRNGNRTSWKNLDKVWELLGDKSAFIAYVIQEVNLFLESG